MKNIKKNFLYNMIYQILIIILPLITVPYVSRVLGSNGIGIYSYTYSIMYYFMLIGMLGINNYGNRSIAKVRDNKEKLSETFLSIYTIQLFMSLTMLIIYYLYIFFFIKQYQQVALIQSFYLIANIFDVNWFFFGIENFRITVIRNTIVKICSLFLIFLLVKEKTDILIYTLILSGSTLISQLLLISFIKKEIFFIKINIKKIKKHIKPCLLLFIPVIAISLYKIMDKIMLGNMTNISEVGLYEQAEKIINIPLGLITALGTVMLPRISNLVEKKEFKQIKKYIEKSIKFIFFLSIPIVFGLTTISNNFIPLFLGKEFTKTSILIKLLSITIIFISFANVIRTQYLIPNEKDGIYVKSVFYGAIINLIMNFIFIPMYGSIGACIGTIAAEFLVMFIQVFFIRKELPIKQYIIDIIPYLLKSLIMFLIIYPFNYIHISNIIRLIIQIGLGCVIYGLLNIKYILSIVNIKEIIKRLIKQ